MSQRDKDLLKAAGLGKQEVATLFGCVRQTIYLGLKESKNYFSVPGTIALLDEARRRDFKGMGALIQFIQSAYSADEQELILWDQVHLAQMSVIAENAKKVVLFLNDDLENLKKTDSCVSFLETALADYPEVLEVLVLSSWVKGYVESLSKKKFKIAVIQPAIPLPAIAFFQAKSDDSVRGFMFGKLSPSEMLAHETTRLWMYLTSLAK